MNVQFRSRSMALSIVVTSLFDHVPRTLRATQGNENHLVIALKVIFHFDASCFPVNFHHPMRGFIQKRLISIS